MYILLFVLLFFLMIGYLLFTESVRISFVFDTECMDMHMQIKWLYPLIDIKAVMVNYSPSIVVYLFKKRIFTKSMKKRTDGANRLSKYKNCLSLSDTYIKTSYSLNDPFETAIANVVVQLLQSLSDNVIIVQYPEFISDHAFIVMQATTNLNAGKTAARIFKKGLFENKGVIKHGSVQSDRKRRYSIPQS